MQKIMQILGKDADYLEHETKKGKTHYWTESEIKKSGPNNGSKKEIT